MHSHLHSVDKTCLVNQLISSYSLEGHLLICLFAVDVHISFGSCRVAGALHADHGGHFSGVGRVSVATCRPTSNCTQLVQVGQTAATADTAPHCRRLRLALLRFRKVQQLGRKEEKREKEKNVVDCLCLR